MHCVKKLQEDLYWVGGNDRRLALFESVYPIPRGVSYNAYVVTDEKTVLLDTVDKSVSGQFFENLDHVLSGRGLDYLIVDHMEPDHCATMEELVLRHPEVKLVVNAKMLPMIRNFFTFDVDSRVQVVDEGDTLSTGKHTFTFLMAPMVHWPEVMVTYDTATKTLFSADAFGTFGAVGGSIFADEVNFPRDWLDDARRYYTNIVGKYGAQVQALLKKAAAVEIDMVCPLHGPVWRKNIEWFVEKYQRWSAYTPEEDGVMIAYASVYGHTENAAEILAAKLAEKGVTNVALYDVSVTHPSVIVSEAFKYSHLVFAAPTYNAGIFVSMETVLHDLKAHALQNRTVGLIQNGSWAPTSGKLMKDLFGQMKDIRLLEPTVGVLSAVKGAQMEQLEALADAIVASLPPAKAIDHSKPVDSGAMFKLSYGLFVLTAAQDGKDNGCIINTVTQLTSDPTRVTIAVNKKNHTHDMIAATGAFNVSVLTEDTPFKVFQRFGFQSGREADKFAGFDHVARGGNGLVYLTRHTNAVLSCKVVDKLDYGTHTLFVADVTEAKTLDHDPSITYAYYFANTKPKPQPKPAGEEKKKKGWVCKICGYVYEGEELPADFICPICKHGAADFEPLT